MLHALSDGEVHTIPAVREELATSLNLSHSDLEELIGRGSTETAFAARIGLGRTLLTHLGLAEAAGPGAVQITAAGQEVLSGDRTPRQGQGTNARTLYAALDDESQPAETRPSAISPQPEPPPPPSSTPPSIDSVRTLPETDVRHVPGPRIIGRGVVVGPNDPVPAAWDGVPEVRVTNADLDGRSPTTDRLHVAWASRQPVVVRLEVNSDRLRDARSWNLPLWQLGERFEPWTDRLHFLVWNNNYDARRGHTPRWHWSRVAVQNNAVDTPSGPN